MLSLPCQFREHPCSRRRKIRDIREIRTEKRFRGFRGYPCSKEKKEFRVSSEGIRVREEERFVLLVRLVQKKEFPCSSVGSDDIRT